MRQLRQPTLILAGNDDPLVPSINGQIMARWLPNARLHVLDCGHLFLMTRAPLAAAEVHAFLLERGDDVPISDAALEAR